MDLEGIAVAVGTGVQALNGITKWVKSLRGGGPDEGSIREVNGNILELQEILIQLQRSLISVTNDLAVKDAEIAKLISAVQRKGHEIYDGNVIWFERDDGNREGPYCPGCWGLSSKTVYLQDYGNGFHGCPACGKTFASVAVRNRPAGPAVGGRNREGEW